MRGEERGGEGRGGDGRGERKEGGSWDESLPCPGSLWRRKLAALGSGAALVYDHVWSWQLAGGCIRRPIHSSPSSPVTQLQVQLGPWSLLGFSLQEAHFQ